MLPDYINATTASAVRKVDTQGVSADGVNNLLAVNAFVKTHLLLVRRTLAVSAGLVGLFFYYIECPEAK